MTEVILPNLNQTGANEWADVEGNDKALRDVINGELDNANLSGSAGITDANLASPNNAAYRPIFWAFQNFQPGLAAATYLVSGAGEAAASGADVASRAPKFVPYFYFASADYEVAGKTQKLRLRAQIACNATKPTIKFTAGLYPVTVAGGATESKFTLGTVVSGSTVAINEPAASTISQGNSGDFAIPSDGAYVLGVVVSGTVTAGSYPQFSGQLQTRSV